MLMEVSIKPLIVIKRPLPKDMTSSAIKQLSKKQKGFFLMVEGSQIDWAGHDHDIVSAMSEMKDFEKSI
ncbi:hypothetical protein BsIDN1_17650 [Bacillus safensis]|uniref:Uncharacterized protein n=1 Tax=Bacillus safensis TaxID=561879 RepID=A0A5S9M3H9_BACIA|nr:hypothetical protein BsIDN1_17650 [Bacillus safensis]